MLFVQQNCLDYYYCNPNVVKLYKARDMIFFTNSDASYPTCSRSKSCFRGFFYLVYLTTIIKNIMAFAAEVEIAALFLNAQLAIPLRVTHIKMGHAQS